MSLNSCDHFLSMVEQGSDQRVYICSNVVYYWLRISPTTDRKRALYDEYRLSLINVGGGKSSKLRFLKNTKTMHDYLAAYKQPVVFIHTAVTDVTHFLLSCVCKTPGFIE